MNPDILKIIFTYSKKYWYIIVIVILLLALLLQDNNNKKLIKEYERQIKESEKIVKSYERDIKINDKKIDSLNIIIKELEKDEIDIIDKINNADSVKKVINKKIDKIQSTDSLILLYPFKDNGDRKPKIKN